MKLRGYDHIRKIQALTTVADVAAFLLIISLSPPLIDRYYSVS